jgi:hypothetical protein
MKINRGTKKWYQSLDLTLNCGPREFNINLSISTCARQNIFQRLGGITVGVLLAHMDVT